MHPFIKLLTTAILILVLLSAGCTDTGGGSGSDPIPVGTETPVHTPEPTPEVDPTSEVDPTPEPTDEITEWMSAHPTCSYTEIPSENNLFGIDMEMYASEKQIANGIYDGFDKDGNHIFRHEEIPEIKSYYFSDGHYQELMDKYGSNKVPIIMEKIDTDRDGELDKVAVRYVGSKGTWTEEFNYDKRADIEDYIIAHISPEVYPSLIID